MHVSAGDIRVDNAKSILGETNGGGNFQMIKIDTSDNMLIGDGNLVIDINGTSERMKIESAGNVRIGTNTNFPVGTAAGGKLDVRGTSDGQLIFDSDGGSQDIKASYNLELWADYDNNNSAGFSNIIFKTDGDNERVRIDNAGNVGIGTATPLAKLDVRGTISGSGNFLGTGDGSRITNNAGLPYLVSGDEAGATNTLQDVCDNGNTTTTSISASDFFIKDGSTQIGQLSKDISSSNFVIKSSVSDADLEFKGVDGGANITAMLIDMSEGGNVGIGTTAPVSKVHIEKTAYDFDSSPEDGDFHLMLKDLDSSVAGDAISIGFAQSTDATTVGAKLSFLTEASHSRGSLVFSTNSTADVGDNTAERMRIDSAGDVGIGTNDPDAKLDVTTAADQQHLKIQGGYAQGVRK